MNRIEIERRYDEFFGTGLWERDYKKHIVIFAEQCVRKQEQDRGKLVADLAEALRDLHDVQNGPPLIQHENEWNEAMKKAGDILGELGL